MNIRRLTAEDLPALARLYHQFWGETSSLPAMRDTFRRIDSDPAYILLAADDGSLCGSAMGVVCQELYGQCRPFMVVEDVVVDRDFRRKGIASALMRELESQASQHGCATIFFVTESERTGARRFYESLGYSPDACSGFKKRLQPPAE